MTISAMWMHGTALAVESPERLASNGRFGWGGDLQVQPGQSTWMHIQVPTPLRVFFLFETFGGRFGELHVFDGGSKVHELKGSTFQANTGRGSTAPTDSIWRLRTRCFLGLVCRHISLPQSASTHRFRRPG